MSWKWPRRLLLILLSMLIIYSALIPEVHTGMLAAGSQLNDLGWTVASYSPYMGNYGVAVTGAGESIYIANSTTGGVNYFMRYNTVENNWGSLSNPPPWFKNGTALAWGGGDYIYALFGGSYGDHNGKARYYFYQYIISGDSWEQLANTPGPQGAGDAITWVPGSALGTQTDWIYAIVGTRYGSLQTTFSRYNINGDNWETLTYNPSWSGEGSDDGSSLVWAGGDYLYALQGEWHETNQNVDRAFARFNLTDNSWDDLLDIPEAGGVSDGGSLVWTGDGYSDKIYALGGGYVGPGETPGDNFYYYNISKNSWTQLDSLPYGITDQNGPRLGYANENIYCWRGHYSAWSGDPDVLWVYAVPEINIGVSISISPSENSGLPTENLTYTVTVTNVGDLADNYDLTVGDNTGWPLTLSDNLLDIPVGENDNVTLSVTIPGDAEYNMEDLITVTATSRTDNTVKNSASCIARTGTAAFSMVNLYTVNVEKILDLNQGSKLVVKFYTYGDAYENENVIENFTTPPTWHVEENESARHPEDLGVKKARLDLTTDNTENVISTIASFIVRKVTLETRFSEVPLEWALAPPAEKVALEAEYSEIPLYWALAPS